MACTDRSLDPALEAALQERLDADRAAADAPGAVLHVRTTEGSWTGASGYAWVAGSLEMGPNDRFRIGSITKTVVGATVLDRVAAGRLSLDDRLATWFPDVPGAEQITVFDLLAHTSGLDDYADTYVVLATMDEPWEAWDLIDVATEDGLLFEPGTDHSYANTNYLLLGLILEEVEGRDWAWVARDRVLKGVRGDFTFPSVDGDVGPRVTGYLGDLEVTGDDFHPSVAGAAGEIVTDAVSLADWAEALYGGDVLDPDQLDAMTTSVVLADGTDTGHGLGGFVEPLPHHDRVSWGHSGSVHGFRSRLRHDPATGTTVVTLVNSFTAEADVIDAGAWETLGSEAGL